MQCNAVQLRDLFDVVEQVKPGVVYSLMLLVLWEARALT
jgi:hypothetical protein